MTDPNDTTTEAALDLVRLAKEQLEAAWASQAGEQLEGAYCPVVYPHLPLSADGNPIGTYRQRQAAPLVAIKRSSLRLVDGLLFGASADGRRYQVHCSEDGAAYLTEEQP